MRSVATLAMMVQIPVESASVELMASRSTLQFQETKPRRVVQELGVVVAGGSAAKAGVAAKSGKNARIGIKKNFVIFFMVIAL